MTAADASPIFRSLDRELWVLTARDGGDAGGLITSSVSEASIVDALPRVTVGLSRKHFTTGLAVRAQAFALHLIAPEQSDWVRRFGTQSGRDVDKFDGLSCTEGETGAPILADASAWVECRIENAMETGDRHWILAEVVAAQRTRGTAPLTFQQFLSSCPDDLKRLLKAQRDEDSVSDARAIEQWRKARRRSER